MRAAAEVAMDGFRNGIYDEVVMVYNEFRNVATQIIRTQQLLPLVAGGRARHSYAGGECGLTCSSPRKRKSCRR